MPDKKLSAETLNNQDKVLAAISYIWILWVIPFVINHKKDFVIQHAKQGLLLFICEIVAWSLGVLPFIGFLLGSMAWMLCIILVIIGIIKAINGEAWQIPYIGHLVDKINNK
ncbi:MAG: DUF4870 domain-containing protein [Patescibacteria group bacterium]|nr:DUF4870 domain-containing protein [Patescibacteria group bacterium]